MAKQTATSAILGKIAKTTKGAYSKSRETEAKAKGGQLPPGLIGAIARFTGYKFDQTKDGVPYVSLSGVVCEPQDCRGKKLSVTTFIQDSKPSSKFPKTAEDRLEELINNIKLICGSDQDKLDAIAGSDLEDLPGILDDMKGLYFTFETWVGKKTKDYPNPQTQINIQGGAEDYEPAEPEETIEETEEANEEAEQTPAPKAGKTTRKPVSKPAPEPEPEAQEDDDGIIPEVGDTWLYLPKGARESSPHEVTSVNLDKGTCALKSEDGKKKYPMVPFSALLGA